MDRPNYWMEKEIWLDLARKKKGNLIYLDLSECSCFIPQIEERWLWHQRLCHVNFDNLAKISKHRRASGIPSLKKPNMGFCRNC